MISARSCWINTRRLAEVLNILGFSKSQLPELIDAVALPF